MRRLFLPTALVLAALLIAPAGAPAQEGGPGVHMLYLITPMLGHAGMVEDGLKQHIQWHADQGDDWTWQVYQIITGPRTGSYYAISEPKSFAEFDGRTMIDPAADTKAADAHVGVHASSVTASLITWRPDLSFRVEGQPLASLFWFNTKHGGEDEAEGFLRKLHDSIAAMDPPWPGNYTVWNTINGAEDGPNFAVSIGHENWAAMGGMGGFDSRAIIASAMGEMEAMASVSSFGDAVWSVESELVALRPDLGSQPADDME